MSLSVVVLTSQCNRHTYSSASATLFVLLHLVFRVFGNFETPQLQEVVGVCVELHTVTAVFSVLYTDIITNINSNN